MPWICLLSCEEQITVPPVPGGRKEMGGGGAEETASRRVHDRGSLPHGCCQETCVNREFKCEKRKRKSIPPPPGEKWD